MRWRHEVRRIHISAKPEGSRSLCSFAPGTWFGTTNDLFSYAIEAYYDGTGDAYGTTDAVEYVQTTLDSCAVTNSQYRDPSATRVYLTIDHIVLINADVLANTVDAIGVVACYGEWQVVATNHYSFANDPVKSMLIPGARSSTGNAIWSSVNNTSNFVFQALSNLAYDLLETGKLALNSTGGSSPTVYSIKLASSQVCPISDISVSSAYV